MYFVQVKFQMYASHNFDYSEISSSCLVVLGLETLDGHELI